MRKIKKVILSLVLLASILATSFNVDQVMAATKTYNWKGNQKVTISGKLSKVTGKHPAGYSISGYVITLDNKANFKIKDGELNSYKTNKIQVMISDADYNKYKGQKVKVTGAVLAPTTAWYIYDIALLKAKVTGKVSSANNKKTSKVTKVSGKHMIIKDKSGNKDQLVLQGKDKNGKVVWTFKSQECVITELDSNQYVVKGDNIYIFSNKLFCINKQTGKVKWTHSKCAVAGVTVTFDSKSNMYCVGYYDDYLYSFSSNGKTRFKKKLPSKYYWPYILKCKSNQLSIRMAGNSEEEDVQVTLYYSTSGKYIKKVKHKSSN